MTVGIPEALLAEGRGLFPGALSRALGDPLRLGETLGVLHEFSLIRRAHGSIYVHRLVQRITRDLLSQSERTRWLNSASQLVTRSLDAPGVEADLHVDHIAQLIEEADA